MKLIIFMLAFVLSLVGCGAAVQPKARVEYIFVKVPKELTKKVPITAPPEPVYYSTLPWNSQEGTLIDLIQKHTKTIGVCNARIQSIEDWSVEQSGIYGPAP